MLLFALLKSFSCDTEEFRGVAPHELRQFLGTKATAIENYLFMTLMVLKLTLERRIADAGFYQSIGDPDRIKKKLHTKSVDLLASIPENLPSPEDARSECHRVFESLREFALQSIVYKMETLVSKRVTLDTFVAPYKQLHPDDDDLSLLSIRIKNIIALSPEVKDGSVARDTCERIISMLKPDIRDLIQKHVTQLKAVKRALFKAILDVSPSNCGQREYAEIQREVKQRIGAIQMWVKKYWTIDACTEYLQRGGKGKNTHAVELKKVLEALFRLFEDPKIQTYLAECYHQRVVLEAHGMSDEQIQRLSIMMKANVSVPATTRERTGL